MKIKRWIKWVILAGAGITAFFIYLPDYTRLKKLRNENARLARDIDKLKKEIDTLKSNIEKLDRDSLIWEELTRKNLGAVKEGEIAVDIRGEGE
jgi:cell division protein FtsB